jgi:hypothetical protein
VGPCRTDEGQIERLYRMILLDVREKNSTLVEVGEAGKVVALGREGVVMVGGGKAF